MEIIEYTSDCVNVVHGHWIGYARTMKCRKAFHKNDYRRVKAEAQAEANQKIAETITDTLISYEQAKNWNGQLPNIYSGGGALPIIATPSEAKEE